MGKSPIPIMDRAAATKIFFILSSFSLPFLAVVDSTITNTQVVSAQSEDMHGHMAGEHGEGGENEIEKLMPSITEWIGVFSLGIFAGIMTFKIDIPPSSNKQNFETKRRRIGTSIAILSISAGVIHLLLVQEHAREAFEWGLFFLISGIGQISFGIAFLFAKKLTSKAILCYIGIAGNALLVITFILVRLIAPPFPPEASPISELEPNGIITLIIEIVLIVLLAFALSFRKDLIQKKLP